MRKPRGALGMEVESSGVVLASKGQWHKRCWPLLGHERAGRKR